MCSPHIRKGESALPPRGQSIHTSYLGFCMRNLSLMCLLSYHLHTWTFEYLCNILGYNQSFPGSSDSKESAFNAGDLGLIPKLGRFPGERNGYPRQYSCLENSMDRGDWQATVHWVTKNQTQLKQLSTHACTQ